MNTHIISIGNELLIGDTTNTNASWIGRHLTEVGMNVTRVHTIPDDAELIKSVISQSMKEADLVITTGGLGPTHDDITKKAVCELFDVEMQLNQTVLDFIKEMFAKRGIPFSGSNNAQAFVPVNCEVLFNKAGTAPGMWFHENGSYLAVLPGVPSEMEYLMKKWVLPKIGHLFPETGVIHKRYLKVAGIGESTLSDNILPDLRNLLGKQKHVTVAFLPSHGNITLRVNSTANTLAEAEQKIQPVIEYIYEKAGIFIYGEGKEVTLSEVIGSLLKERKLTIAVAESCSGGLIANLLTDIPGSSEYMMGGVVAYSNSVKKEVLGVSQTDIETVGAVSKEVALQMAQNVAARLGADIGISTTGVAGPGGGTPEKPVGTIWIGFFGLGYHFALNARLTNDRLINKSRAASTTLETVRRVLKGIDTMPYQLKQFSA